MQYDTSCRKCVRVFVSDNDLTRLSAPYLIRERHYGHVTSLRQWGRHVLLVSSHDDRNGSETRSYKPAVFLLHGRSHPWRPTFARINVRHGTRGDPRTHTSDLQATISFTLRLNVILINSEIFNEQRGARNIASARRVIAIREKISSFHSFALPRADEQELPFTFWQRKIQTAKCSKQNNFEI